jgi:hypothetical protein
MQGSLSSFVNSSSRVVDRYISIQKGQRPSFTVYSLGNAKIEFYTNYIFFSKDIVSYEFKGLGTTDMIINSQERGYASEYLGFFTKNSDETYNGTIVYIEPDDPQKPLGAANNGYITIQGKKIYSGFYFIPAKDGGTSITALTDLGAENNTKGKPWAIDPAELPKYSIYIKQDGTLSDAYVDTGLIGNGDLGESGFSGGNVG